jgi:hypothetical protein
MKNYKRMCSNLIANICAAHKRREICYEALDIRKCEDCGQKIWLLKDKHFLKNPSKFKQTIEIIIKVIIPTIMNKTIFTRKIICEMCNRNDKIKKLGV